jgi:hypothetical protein
LFFDSIVDARASLTKARFTINKILTRDLCSLEPSRRTVANWFSKLSGLPEFKITKDILLELEMTRVAAEVFLAHINKTPDPDMEDTWVA